MTSLIALVAMVGTTGAMSYEQARNEALFLTDKMAYELNLTDEQYDAAYEINLDYLMGVTSVDDVYGDYWTRRNYDLGYILLDWQWEAYLAASYFYRPLYWATGCWHFGIYARYPRRTFFYFDYPTVFHSYRGGHSWHHNGGHSYYKGVQANFRGSKNHSGMRDQWNRGDYSGRQSAGAGSRQQGVGSNQSRQNTGSGSNRQGVGGQNRGRVGSGSQSSSRSRYSGNSSSTRVTVDNNSRTGTVSKSSVSRQSSRSNSKDNVSRKNTSSNSKSSVSRKSTSSSKGSVKSNARGVGSSHSSGSSHGGGSHGGGSHGGGGGSHR